MRFSLPFDLGRFELFYVHLRHPPASKTLTSVASFISTLQARGIHLSVRDGVLQIEGQKADLSADDLHELHRQNSLIVDLLQSGGNFSEEALVRRERAGSLPLSFAQERLWVISQIAPRSAIYNIPVALRLNGSVDIRALRDALQSLVNRHESLRTIFPSISGEPRQEIIDDLHIDLPILDIGDTPSDQTIIGCMKEEAMRPFDLSRAPLLRAKLLRMTQDQYVFVFVIHHIVSDGWSMEIFLRELWASYTAFATGTTPVLPELPIQYADFASWQRRWLQGEVLAVQLDYWCKQLRDAPDVIDLPTDRVRSESRREGGARHPIHLPESLVGGLLRLRRTTTATLFMVMLAAYELLLYRYSGQRDLCVGTPIANRNRKQIEGVIGFFVNTLIIRSQPAPDMTFRSFLGQIRQTLIDAYAHQDLPVEYLLNALNIKRNLGRAAYRQACFAFRRLATRERQVPATFRPMKDIAVEPIPLDRGATTSDLLLSVIQLGTEVAGHWEYATALFDESTIIQFNRDYVQLLEQIVENPDTCLAEFRLGHQGPRDDSDVSLLSPASLAIWNELRDAPDRERNYNIRSSLALEGDVSPARLQAAIDDVVATTPALRQTFRTSNSNPTVELAAAAAMPLCLVDFSNSADPEVCAHEWISQQSESLVTSKDATLFRHGLVRVSSMRSYWYMQHHRLLLDEVGLNIFAHKVARTYRLLERGEKSVDTDNGRYVEYVSSASRHRFSTGYFQAQSYWAKIKRGNAVSLCVNRRPAKSNKVTLQRHVSVGAGSIGRLQEAASTLGLTPAQFLTAVAFLYVQRATSVSNAVVGIRVDGRIGTRANQLVGSFADTLPFSTSVSPDLPLSQYMSQIRDELQTWVSFQQFCGSDIRRVQQIPVGEPLFRVAIRISEDSGYDFGEFYGRPNIVTCEFVEDLCIAYRCTADEINVQICGNGYFYADWELSAHAENLRQLIASATALPSGRVADIPIPARHSPVGATDKVDESITTRSLVHELISTQSRATPNAIAIKSNNQQWTYRQLEEISERISKLLLCRPASKRGTVAIFGRRSPETLIALLGVLKAGQAYLVLDPESPPTRLKYLLDDSGAAALLATTPLTASLSLGDVSLIHVDDAFTCTFSPTAQVEFPDISGKDLAYCIYTSGSTGAPKAVGISHESMRNHSLFIAGALRLSAADHVAQFSNLTFDASVEEIFPTWIAGATLVLRGEEIPSAQELSAFILRERISILNLPTAYWHIWVASLSADFFQQCHLKAVVVGGEKVSSESYARWRDLSTLRQIVWLNTYGPTETTVICSAYRADEATATEHDVPIGRPISATQIYILDDGLRQLPPGIVGELYVGGMGVARGYLHKPGLTAERFIADPFSGTPGARMYKTGDLARWRSDGNIEYVGRRDNQLKIRGFRIEPAEIEAHLLTHARVLEAAVVSVEESPADKRLIACFVSAAQDSPSAEDLRIHLRASLPAYMIPQHFIRLDRLPLTSAGKLDRKQLAAQANAPSRVSYVAPGTTIDKAVAMVFALVLNADRVGTSDNFFDLGGHSLLAVRAVAEIRTRLGLELSLEDFFRAPTVGELAKRIMELQGTALAETATATDYDEDFI